MILRKTMIDGKETYERISLDEALESDRDDLVFTDEDEKEEYEYVRGEKRESDDNGGFSFRRNGRHLHMNIDLPGKFKGFGKIMTMLPFMEDEDIHELVNRIIDGDQSVSGMPLVAMMPFLQDEDCDRLFLKCLKEGPIASGRLVAMAPFVSEQCLTVLVDEYLAGSCPDLQLDGLYPFMSSKDVKRLFEYRILQRQEERD